MFISFRKYLQALLIVNTLLLCIPVYAQENKTYPVFLSNGVINAPVNIQQWTDSILKLHLTEPLQVIVVFKTIPQQQDRIALANAGIQLQEYLPDNSFIAIIQQPGRVGALNIPNVVSGLNMQPAWKVNSYCIEQVEEAGNRNIDIVVSFYDDADLSASKKLIEQYSGVIIPDKNLESLHTYKVQVAADKVMAISKWYGVKYINSYFEIVPLDYRSKGMEKANIASLPAVVGGYGLLGDGVSVGVGDNTSAIYHADTKDRVINYNPAPISHHGQHINGIVGSAGIIDPNAEGIAPHATLVDHLYEDVVFQCGVMQKVHNVNATNNSYALTEGNCAYNGSYDLYSNMVDKIAMQYPAVGHVFAAGNDGGLNCSPFPQGFGTIIGGYQSSKNMLVVTSTDKMYNNAWDGSRGPTKDRRLKPDMSANGVDVFSDIGVDVYSVAGGTSMASPQVAGAYALLTQRFRQLFGSSATPRSDVIKAILVNSSTDIGNPGPDYRFGFGFLNLYRALQTLDNNRYATNIINDASAQNISITVPPNTAILKVMLYWHDTAASATSKYALVNDLDLTVTDASSVIHKPLVLDTALANINNDATEKEDHLNNCEQVTIHNPAAGTYTISVRGFRVPFLGQKYAIAYDFVPVGVQITYPFKGDVIKSNDSFQVYWDASPDTHSFTLEYSINNGSSWTTIDNNIGANQLNYTWKVPNINSEQVKLRLTRNGTAMQSTTAAIVFNKEPKVTLDTLQCPGYIHINWDANPNANGYEVMRKIGPYMQVVDTVAAAANTYIFAGLSPDSIYYVAVRPLINSNRGFRSLAVRYQPNTGSCAGWISDGDLRMAQIICPNSGRQFTSTELGSNEKLIVQVQNLDDASCSSHRISYNINGGTWQSATFTKVIPANGVIIDTIAGLNLSALGSYTIKTGVTNLAKTDPIRQNDSLVKTVLQLRNDTVNATAGFMDDFETMPAINIGADAMGISPNEHWDYANSVDTAGRLRSFVNDSILISGNRSISLDANQAIDNNQNYFTGTFNLSNYDAFADEVRTQFDYIVHGIPKFTNGNELWVRGGDTQPWVLLYPYHTSEIGTVISSGSLSLSDAVYNNHQIFLSSLQIRFGQRDTSLIANRNFGNGVTIDNFRIYTVHNDVQMLRIVSPTSIECGSTVNMPVVVEVYNSVRQVQNNVQLFYQLDGGAIVKDTLNTIAGKDTVLFNFTKPLSSLSTGAHTLNVWLIAVGDTYTENDSMLNYKFHNQPLIANYPYLQNFEANDGNWYAEGQNSSWEYGTPASQRIHKAASGTKAWKTALAGHYHDRELSYLYSPCFDISTLNKPMLSFSFAMEFENCGNTLCDGAYLEYSTDDDNWTKLGVSGDGTNWYDAPLNVWNEDNNTRWHVASIPLPKMSQPIKLRFVMESDPAVNYDGIAVDDIHIFDLKYPIYDGVNTAIVLNSVSGNNWTDYVTNSQLQVQMNAEGQSIQQLEATGYYHPVFSNVGGTQYYFPRNFTLKVSQGSLPTDSVGARLYVLDKDMVTMLTDTTCPSCTRPEDVYSMGITKYDDNDKSKEDGSLDNNLNGVYSFYPYSAVQWVPYDKGYYAEIKLKSFSELWFNDGGPTGNFPIGIDYLSFNAKRINSKHVQIDWTSNIDTAISNYEVQRGDDTIHFTTLGTVSPGHLDIATYQYLDSPIVIVNNVVWYRLRYTMNNGKVYYSRARRVDWTDENQLKVVYPNPNTDGTIYIEWSATTGTEMKIVITDITGRIVYNRSVIATEWNNKTTITNKQLGKGVYILKTEIGPNSFTTKLVYR